MALLLTASSNFRHSCSGSRARGLDCVSYWLLLAVVLVPMFSHDVDGPLYAEGNIEVLSEAEQEPAEDENSKRIPLVLAVRHEPRRLPYKPVTKRLTSTLSCASHLGRQSAFNLGHRLPNGARAPLRC
jgi:hypothetical protein